MISSLRLRALLQILGSMAKSGQPPQRPSLPHELAERYLAGRGTGANGGRDGKYADECLLYLVAFFQAASRSLR